MKREKKGERMHVSVGKRAVGKAARWGREVASLIEKFTCVFALFASNFLLTLAVTREYVPVIYTMKYVSFSKEKSKMGYRQPTDFEKFWATFAHTLRRVVFHILAHPGF